MPAPLILSLLPRPAHPTRDGMAIRNFHLLAGLSERFRVRAIALRAPHLRESEYPAGVDVEEIPQAGRALRRIAAIARSLASATPYSVRLYRSAVLERRVRAVAARESPAWVLAHSYHLGLAALASGARSWIDFHNLDSEIWDRVARTATSAAVRLFAAREAPRVRAFEANLLRHAGGVSCVSERDAAAMRRLAAEASPFVAPNGVDLSRYAFRSETAAEELVFFVGDLSWPPNAQAVRWFRRAIWPSVRSLAPRAVAEIVGREPPADLRRDVDGAFRVVGEASDTRPHWRRAAVAVVPIRAAGGTRLKILEAAACGVPVVSTSVGAEGLDLEPETEILLRDDAVGFAGAVAGLLERPDLALRQAAAARRKVERSYGWEGIGRCFAEELARRSRT